MRKFHSHSYPTEWMSSIMKMSLVLQDADAKKKHSQGEVLDHNM